MVCVCVCDFRSRRSFKPSFSTFPTLTQFKQFLFHREKYSKYDDHFRYYVAVWAEKHGQQQAGKKYAISESTARGFLKSYRTQKSTAKALKQGRRGKRTMVPTEIDE